MHAKPTNVSGSTYNKSTFNTVRFDTECPLEICAWSYKHTTSPHTHTHTRIQTHARVLAHAYLYARAHIWTYAYIQMRTHLNMSARMHAHTQAHPCARTACIQLKHTHKHTHTHTTTTTTHTHKQQQRNTWKKETQTKRRSISYFSFYMKEESVCFWKKVYKRNKLHPHASQTVLAITKSWTFHM